MRQLLPPARPRLRIALWALGACTATSCTPEALCETAVPVVNADGWLLDEPVDAPSDALLCTSENVTKQFFGIKEVVEIDTGPTCGFATLRRSSDAALGTGETLLIRMFYASQTVFPAAQAHVTVSVGDLTVLDEQVAIPAQSGLLPEQPRIVVDRDVPAGAPVLFHVGNHGDNSWSLVELSVLRQEPCR
jgi:hypothetical protein